MGISLKQRLILWIEDYLFFPSLFQRFISLLLLPLTFIYHLILIVKRVRAKAQDFGLPVISVGNLIVGGSGKTPLVIYLAKDKKNVAIVLRGYGRESKGLYVISTKGKILEDISISGDEAMLLAKSLPHATVIVSEDRAEGIKKAKELKSTLVILDDGFSKYNIKKFDILLRPKNEPTNLLCIPSGGYREPKIMYSTADLVLQEGVDFKRLVTYKLKGQIISVLPQKLLLLTAISKAKRLLDFLPESTKLIIFEDHHNYTLEEVEEIISKNADYSIITTSKDMVKLENLNIPNIFLMDLDIEMNDNISFIEMNNYIELYNKPSK